MDDPKTKWQENPKEITKLNSWHSKMAIKRNYWKHKLKKHYTKSASKQNDHKKE